MRGTDTIAGGWHVFRGGLFELFRRRRRLIDGNTTKKLPLMRRFVSGEAQYREMTADEALTAMEDRNW